MTVIQHFYSKGKTSISNSNFHITFVRMLQGLVEGLFSVSMSLISLASRLDFFFVIRYTPSKSLTQMVMYLS